jgi:hypothetical protein
MSHKCEESFTQRKHLLTISLALKIVYPKWDFILSIDTRKEGIGGFLRQYNHVVCYEYLNLKGNESNYPTHDMELLVIIHALKMWFNYLIRRKFLLVIYHNGIKNLFCYLHLNSKQARWLDFLSKFEF